MEDGTGHRENISVAFYHNDSKSHGSGLTGWFKSGMDYWHTEVAFPMSIYQRPDGSAPAGGDRLFAYGVFDTHVDVIPSARLVHQGEDAMVFAIGPAAAGRTAAAGVQAQRLTVSASKGWKDVTAREFPSLPEGGDRPVEAFESRGRVSVTWARSDRAANRFSKAEQRRAKVTVSHSKQVVKLELPGIVFGKPREFSNPAYTWIHINVPFENAVHAAQFAEEQVGKPHDPNGIYWAMVWPRRTDHRQYYCVNLVASVLQQAGMLQGINPSFLLPDDLHRLLEHHPDRILAANPHITARAWDRIGKPRTFSSARRAPPASAAPRAYGTGGDRALPARGRKTRRPLRHDSRVPHSSTTP